MNNDDFLTLARERFERCVAAERENRVEAKIDLRFIAGDQWDEREKRLRENPLNPRPALVFQKLTGPCNQVANEARQNRPVVKISPIGSGASKDTAEVLEGIIRHITYDSSGDVAGEIALENAVRSGFGYFGLTTDYEEPEDADNWNQVIRFRSFPNHFLIYIDPDAKEPDKSDIQFAFVVDTLTRAEYTSQYPKSEVSEANCFEGVESPAADWVGGNKVTVAEYWLIEKTRKQVTRDGETRTVETRKVKQYIINGVEILEEHEWAGKHIPIIPVYGPEINLDGKVVRQSLIRQARDPQRLHNYYKTIEAESIALAPRPKWVGAVGQFKTDRDWNTGAMSNKATLQYDPVATNNLLVPPPQWHTFEPPIQALSLGALQSADDIKASTHIFDAGLGQRSNETSGRAIDARKMESDVANSHFLDNLSRAITFAGKQLVDLIPKIYDTARELRIVGEDDTQKIVQVNQPYQDPETGKVQTYMLAEGKFGVIVTTGPDFGTKRKESFELFSDLSKAYPALMQMCGDLILRNSDIPGADAMADRLKKALPPNLADDDKDNAIPPQAQAKLQQQAQMIDQLTQAVHSLSSQIEMKTMDAASRERVALIAARAAITQAIIRAQSTESLAAFQAEIDQIDRQLGMIPDPAMQQQQGGGGQQTPAQPQMPQAA